MRDAVVAKELSFLQTRVGQGVGAVDLLRSEKGHESKRVEGI